MTGVCIFAAKTRCCAFPLDLRSSLFENNNPFHSFIQIILFISNTKSIFYYIFFFIVCPAKKQGAGVSVRERDTQRGRESEGRRALRWRVHLSCADFHTHARPSLQCHVRTNSQSHSIGIPSALLCFVRGGGGERRTAFRAVAG